MSGSYAEPSGGRRARSEPTRRRAADKTGEPGLSVPRGRRRHPEPSPADEYSEPNRDVAVGRRVYPEPGREPLGAERSASYRGESHEDGVRSWHIPDEPWRGTEEPWKGIDGEYHTGQFEAVSDDDAAGPDGSRRPDLTVIAGKGAEVREYESNYEGRDVAPLTPPRRDSPPPGRDGDTRGRADQVRLPQQPRSGHLRAVPGDYPGRLERG